MGTSMEVTYMTGEIIDYRDSWIWVGANNSLDSCAEEHRGFLFGEISSMIICDNIINDGVSNYLDISTYADPCVKY